MFKGGARELRLWLVKWAVEREYCSLAAERGRLSTSAGAHKGAVIEDVFSRKVRLIVRELVEQ